MYQRQLRLLSIPAFRAQILSQVLREAGIAHEPPLPEDSRHPADGSTMISAERDVDFQRRFVDLTAGRPDLWFSSGVRQTPLSFGVHGLAALSAPTVHELWTMLEQTREISISFNTYNGLRDGPTMIGVEIDDRETPAELREYALYREIGSLITTLRELTGGALALSRVELPVKAPADTAFLDAFVPDVRFECAHTRVFWPHGAAEKPLLHGNAFLHRHYLGQCQKLVDAVRAEDLAARLLGMMADETLDLAAAARRLNQSERTLQRRLLEEGINFRELSNQAMMDRAKRLLSNLNLSVGEVALRLGYAEIASFTRAFRRWTGRSPRAFRADLRGSPPR